MAQKNLKWLLAIVFIILLVGCASKRTQNQAGQGTAGSGLPPGFSGEPLPVSESNTLDPETLKLDGYIEELVDNFLVILDASGSKYLPYKQQVKLKVAKDIARRFNQRVPKRPLTGGLRRYGFEAGAFSTKTRLIYGMTDYSRQDFADAIEIVRWAGGKTPMALAIDKGSDDMINTQGYAALVLISDGKVLKKDADPVLAARRMKERYGDRLCIYTVVVGDDEPLDEAYYHNKKELMTNVANEGKCGYSISSDDLVSDRIMDDFVDDVFTRKRKLKPEEADRGLDGPCPDEDNDGVCDADDECPGTPIGAKVDDKGCWVIENVQFDLNKWNIKPEYYRVIDDVARVMKLNPDLKIEVNGHTCTIWTEDYNMKLSHWRAMAVTSYLIKKRGVPSHRISVKGFGYHRPTASNTTEKGRSLNRRAEFRPIR